MKRKILVVAIAAFAGLNMPAQEKKEVVKKVVAPAGGILHPEMKVENGTYEKPMATIGSKPDQPWTTTSVAAGVDSKPQPATLVKQTDWTRIKDFGYLQIKPQMAAGDYNVQIIITDLLANGKNTVTSQSVDFEVVE